MTKLETVLIGFLVTTCIILTFGLTYVYCTRKQPQKSESISISGNKFASTSNDNNSDSTSNDSHSPPNGNNNSDSPSNDSHSPSNDNNNSDSTSNDSHSPPNGSNNSNSTSNDSDNASNSISPIIKGRLYTWVSTWVDTEFNEISSFPYISSLFEQHLSSGNSSNHRFPYTSSNIEHFLNSQDPLSAQELLNFCKKNQYKWRSFTDPPPVTEQISIQRCIDKIKYTQLYKNDPYEEALINYLYDLKQGKQII